MVRVCAAGSWLAVLGDKVLIHRFDDDVFDVSSRNAGDRSDRYRLGLSLEMRQRGVIAIADSSFGGVSSVGPLIGELLLDGIKKLSIHDRWLLAGQDFTLVFDLADIEPVAQQIEQRAAFEGNAATGRTGCAQSCLGSDVFISEVSHQRVDAAEFE